MTDRKGGTDSKYMRKLFKIWKILFQDCDVNYIKVYI